MKKPKLNVHKIFSSLLICLLTISLTSCNEEIPQVQTNYSSAPVLDANQIDSIRTDLYRVLELANQGDSSQLEERVDQPVLDVIRAGLKAKSSGVDTTTLSIPTSTQLSLVTNSQTWPRNTFIITNITQDRQTERLLLLNQDSPRNNYKLKFMVRLFTNQELPKFDVLINGSPNVPANDTTLSITPLEAFKYYADVLQKDTTSQYASSFENDLLRQEIQSGHTLATNHLDKVSGNQTEEFVVNEQSIRAIRSFDGGSLVVGAIESKWTRTANGNSLATPASDIEKAIAQGVTFGKTIQVDYANFVALYIANSAQANSVQPSSSPTSTIRILGAERYPIKVTTMN